MSKRPDIEFLTKGQKAMIKSSPLYKRLCLSDSVLVRGCYLGPSLKNSMAGESIFFILEEDVSEEEKALIYDGFPVASEKECYGQGTYALETQKGILDAYKFEERGFYGHKVNQFFTRNAVYTLRLTEDKNGVCSLDFKYAFQKEDGFEGTTDYGFTYWFPVRAVTLLSDEELLIFNQQCPEEARKKTEATKDEIAAYEYGVEAAEERLLRRERGVTKVTRRLTLEELKRAAGKLEKGYALARKAQTLKQKRDVRARERDADYFDRAACVIPDLCVEAAEDDDMDVGGQGADEETPRQRFHQLMTKARAAKARKCRHKSKAGNIVRRQAAKLL